MSIEVGSINAKLVLDISSFIEGIKNASTMASKLSATLSKGVGNIGGFSAVAKEAKKLQGELGNTEKKVEALTQKMNQTTKFTSWKAYRNELKSLQAEFGKVANAVQKANQSFTGDKAGAVRYQHELRQVLPLLKQVEKALAQGPKDPRIGATIDAQFEQARGAVQRFRDFYKIANEEIAKDSATLIQAIELPTEAKSGLSTITTEAEAARGGLQKVAVEAQKLQKSLAQEVAKPLEFTGIKDYRESLNSLAFAMGLAIKYAQQGNKEFGSKAAGYTALGESARKANAAINNLRKAIRRANSVDDNSLAAPFLRAEQAVTQFVNTHGAGMDKTLSMIEKYQAQQAKQTAKTVFTQAQEEAKLASRAIEGTVLAVDGLEQKTTSSEKKAGFFDKIISQTRETGRELGRLRAQQESTNKAFEGPSKSSYAGQEEEIKQLNKEYAKSEKLARAAGDALWLAYGQTPTPVAKGQIASLVADLETLGRSATGTKAQMQRFLQGVENPEAFLELQDSIRATLRDIQNLYKTVTQTPDFNLEEMQNAFTFLQREAKLNAEALDMELAGALRNVSWEARNANVSTGQMYNSIINETDRAQAAMSTFGSGVNITKEAIRQMTSEVLNSDKVTQELAESAMQLQSSLGKSDGINNLTNMRNQAVLLWKAFKAATAESSKMTFTGFMGTGELQRLFNIITNTVAKVNEVKTAASTIGETVKPALSGLGSSFDPVLDKVNRLYDALQLVYNRGEFPAMGPDSDVLEGPLSSLLKEISLAGAGFKGISAEADKMAEQMSQPDVWIRGLAEDAVFLAERLRDAALAAQDLNAAVGEGATGKSIGASTATTTSAASNANTTETASIFSRIRQQVEQTATWLQLVNTSTKAANTSAVQLNNSFKNTGRAVDELRKQLRPFGTEIKNITRGILIAQIFYGITRSFREMVASAHNFVLNIRASQIAFKYLMDDAQAAASYMEAISQFSLVSPLAVQDITSAARQLQALGFSAKSTLPVLNILTDTAAVFSQNANDMNDMISRIVLAMGQMQAAGRIMGTELRQLYNAGIPVYRLLQEQLGLTPEQARNISRLGIDVNTAITALLKGLAEEYKGAAAEFAKTIPALLTKIRDSFGQLAVASLGVPYDFVNAGLMKWAATMTALVQITKAYGPGGLFQALFPKEMHMPLRNFIGSLGELVKAVSAFGQVGAAVFGTVLRMATIGFSLVLPPMTIFLSSLMYLVRWLVLTVPWVQGLFRAFEGVGAILAAALAFKVLYKIMLAPVIGFVIKQFLSLLAVLNRITIALMTNPWLIPIVLLGAVLVRTTGLVDKLNGGIRDLWSTMMDAPKIDENLGIGFDPNKILTPDFKEQDKGAKDYLSTVDSLSDAYRQVEDSVDGAKKATDKLFNQSFDEVYSINEDKGDAFGISALKDIDLSGFLEQLTEIAGLSDQIDFTGDFDVDWGNLQSGIGGLSDYLKDFNLEMPSLDFTDWGKTLWDSIVSSVQDPSDYFSNIIGAVVAAVLVKALGLSTLQTALLAAFTLFRSWYWNALGETMALPDTAFIGNLAAGLAMALVGVFTGMGPFALVFGAIATLCFDMYSFFLGTLAEDFKKTQDDLNRAGIGQLVGSALGAVIGLALGGPVGAGIGIMLGNFAGGLAGLFISELNTALKVTEVTRAMMEPIAEASAAAQAELANLFASAEPKTAEGTTKIIGHFNTMADEAIAALDRLRLAALEDLALMFGEDVIDYQGRLDDSNRYYDGIIEGIKREGKALDDNYRETVRIYGEESAEAKKALKEFQEWQTDRIEAIEEVEEARKKDLERIKEEFEDTLGEYFRMEEEINNHYERRKENITQAEKDIIAEMKKYIAEGGKVTDQKYLDLLKKLDEFNTTVIEETVENEEERNQLIKEKDQELLRQQAEAISARLQEAARERDGKIKEAQKTYDEAVAEANRLKEGVNGISQEQYDELIKQAQQNRYDTITEAQGMYNDVVAEVTKGMEGIDEEINTQTGQILTKWDKFWNGLATGLDDVFSAVGRKVSEVLDWFEDLFENERQAGKMNLSTIGKGGPGGLGEAWQNQKIQLGQRPSLALGSLERGAPGGVGEKLIAPVGLLPPKGLSAMSPLSGIGGPGDINNRELFRDPNKAALTPAPVDYNLVAELLATKMASALEPYLTEETVVEGEAPLPPMYVGTLIADDRGLRELYSKFKLIATQDAARGRVTGGGAERVFA